MPFSRRTFLRGAGLSAALLTVPSLDRLRSAAAQDESRFRSADWILASPGDWAGGEATGLVRLPEGGIALREGASGTFLSPVHPLPFRAEGAGLRWILEGAPPEALHLRLRASDDGSTWGAWHEVIPLAHGATEADSVSEFVHAAGRYQQFAVELRAAAGQRPVLRRVELRAVGSEGPDRALAEAAARAPFGATGSDLGPAAPSIISRAGWGCPEATSSSWKPSYQNAVKLFVHHTVTTNNDVNPPATVRAVWQYHARTLGWGDVGYNFLIDRYGNIYDGRHGGDNVIAGHALCYNRGSVGIALLGDFTSVEPTGAAIDALIALIAWKAFQQRINPLKSGYFINRVLGNICGHRDGNDGCGFRTTCPGTRLYNRFDDIRNLAWSRLPDYALAWGSGINTPSRLKAGEVVSVPFEVSNLGRQVWNNTDPFPWVLGYHWYRGDGSQYVQSFEEDKRTKLPKVLEFGDSTRFDGWVQVPREPGRYTLRWDMVHEGDTWLADRGNPTVDANVEVDSDASGEPGRPTHRAEWDSHETPARLAPGQSLTVRLDLKNTGSATWHANAPNSFRVGYHWYRPDGSQFIQSSEDDRRTHFPNEVGADQWVTVRAGLTAPTVPGAYTLTWDIVQEGVTWFADRGSPTLNVTVDVAGSLSRLFAPFASRQ